MPSDKLNLIPGISVGSFEIGNTLFNTLNFLRSYKFNFPNVKISWDEYNPSTSSIYIQLNSPPISLLFEPLTQRLVKIEVENPSLWISYRGRSFDSPEEEGGEEVMKVVRRIMGPTHSSSKSKSNNTGEGEEEILSYPGVIFGITRNSTPTRGSSTLSRIVVTPLPHSTATSSEDEVSWMNPKLPKSPSIAHGDLKLVQIQLDKDFKPFLLVFKFHSSSSDVAIESFPVVLHSTHSSDLLARLGTSIRLFYKEDDRMTIHSSSTSSDLSKENPYFQSYPHLAVTFLLHPTLHTVLKVIFHSNLPGESHFGRTSRCFIEWVQFTSHDCEGGGEILGTSELKGSTLVNILSKGAEGGKRERPMELDREVDVESGKTLGGAEEGILGKMTEIHGFDGIGLELTRTDEVETVWIF